MAHSLSAEFFIRRDSKDLVVDDLQTGSQSERLAPDQLYPQLHTEFCGAADRISGQARRARLGALREIGFRIIRRTLDLRQFR